MTRARAPGDPDRRRPGPAAPGRPLPPAANARAAARRERSALILLVALIAYLDRDGYTDGAGGSLTPLDAVYYSTVSLTTTGYGDIYPASQSARALTAFVITPLRVVFLVLLVGTTVEILTESTRQLWRVRRWRKTVRDHTIVCGYGTKGVSAIEALCGNGRRARAHRRRRARRGAGARRGDAPATRSSSTARRARRR